MYFILRLFNFHYVGLSILNWQDICMVIESEFCLLFTLEVVLGPETWSVCKVLTMQAMRTGTLSTYVKNLVWQSIPLTLVLG